MSRERAISFFVSLDAAPATTATLPPVCSTVISTTRRCSAPLIVAASPVDPHGTTKWTPLAICQSTNDLSDRSSISPEAVNGVTRAVPHPVSRCESIVPPRETSPRNGKASNVVNVLWLHPGRAHHAFFVAVVSVRRTSLMVKTPDFPTSHPAACTGPSPVLTLVMGTGRPSPSAASPAIALAVPDGASFFLV